MSAPKCPAREELLDYALGRLPDEAIEAVAQHIEHCPDCQCTMATVVDAADTLVAQLAGPPEPDAFADEPECQELLVRAKALAGGGGLREEVHAMLAAPAQDAGDLAGDLGQLGEYQLLAKLGEGGMGAVYKARQVRLDKIVALKVLSKQRTADPNAVARFEREMKAVGRVSHPNIIQAHDARDIEGTTVLVMEYADGLDLAEVPRRSGPLSVADASEIVRQAALGLQAIHENGLVHRDIKPSNLMLTPQGQVKILDLGLALLQTGMAGSETTSSGQVMGTADYMAPEQVFDSHKVDIRADIYSLGCTLYKLLTGQAPFSGPEYDNSMKKLLAHVEKRATAVGQFRDDLPPKLCAVLDRMMAKTPDKRFATPGEVAEALTPFTPGCDLKQLAADAADTVIEAGTAPLSLTDTERSSRVPSNGAARRPAALVKGLRRRPMAVALALAGLAAVVLFGMVLTLTGRYGTLIVETDDKDVHVAVTRGGEEVAVADSDAGWTIRLKSGEYDLDLKGGRDQFQIERDTITVRRGDAVRVKVTRRPVELAAERTAVAKPAAAPAATPAPPANEAKMDVRSFAGHTAPVRCAVFSPDGRTILSGGDDKTIRLWNVETGKEIRCFEGHAAPVTSLAFSPDGRQVASGDEHGSIRLWDLQKESQPCKLEKHISRVCSLAFSPDGKQLLSGSDDTTAVLWEVPPGKRLHVFCLEQNARIRQVAFLPHSRQITIVTGDSVRLWDPETEKEIHRLGDGWFLRLSPSGAHAFSCGVYCDVPVLGVMDLVARAGMRLNWPDPQLVDVAPSPNGLFLASVTDKGPIRVRRISGGHEVCSLTWGRTDSVCFSPDSHSLLVCGGETPADRRAVRMVRLPQWLEPLAGLVPRPKALTGFRQWQIQAKVPYDRRYQQVAWSPDGRYLACSSRTRGLTPIYDATSLQVVRILPTNGTERIAWSPDSQNIATWRDGGRLCLWSADGTPLRETFVLADPPWQMADWAPDGTCLVTGARRWNLDLTPGPPFPGAPDSASYAAISPDAKTVAFGCRDNTVRLVSQEGKPGPVLRPPAGLGGAVSFTWSPDGKHMAAAWSEQMYPKITFHRVDGTIVGPRELVGGDHCCWSPDGKLLSSHHWYVQTFAWQESSDATASWKQLWRIGTVAGFHSFGWSPDGKWLANFTSGLQLYARDGRPGPSVPGLSGRHVGPIAWEPDGTLVVETVGNADEYFSGSCDHLGSWHSGPKPGAVLQRSPANRKFNLPVPYTVKHPDGTQRPGGVWSPDRKLCCKDEKVLDEQGKLVFEIKHPNKRIEAWSPDSEFLATGGGEPDNTVRLWSANGSAGPVLSGHTNGIGAVAWKLDASQLATAGGDKTVRIWGRDGVLARTIPVDNWRGVSALEWSPDGVWLAVHLSGTIQLWKADGTPGPKFPPRGNYGRPRWSPDGSRLAAERDGALLDILNVDGSAGPSLDVGPAVHRWHRWLPPDFAWSPDGKRIFAVFQQGVTLWDADSGEPIWVAVLLSNGDLATLGPDGRLLAGDIDAVDESLFYVVERTDGRREVLTPSQFQKLLPKNGAEKAGPSSHEEKPTAR